jgi:hypothetical protein
VEGFASAFLIQEKKNQRKVVQKGDLLDRKAYLFSKGKICLKEGFNCPNVFPVIIEKVCLEKNLLDTGILFFC